MDFCILDTEDELDSYLSKSGFFTRNLVTFINFSSFEEQYLTIDPAVMRFGLFSLQHNYYISDFHSFEKGNANFR